MLSKINPWCSAFTVALEAPLIKGKVGSNCHIWCPSEQRWNWQGCTLSSILLAIAKTLLILHFCSELQEVIIYRQDNQ